MAYHIYKSLEITGSSPIGIEDAVKKAIEKAAQTLHNLRWFEVTSMRGVIEGNAVQHWQVTMKIGFTLDE